MIGHRAGNALYKEIKIFFSIQSKHIGIQHGMFVNKFYTENKY